MPRCRVRTRRVLVVLLLALVAGPALAASATTIVIKADAFAPKTLTIPAGKQVQVMVHNQTPLPAEFEGTDFAVEKVVPADTKLPVYIGPLKPGTYHFFNEFNPSVTGTLTVR